MTNRYPIYIPSLGRPGVSRFSTARLLTEWGVKFRLVVEPHERDAYVATHGADSVLVLPFQGLGHAAHARNWIKDHAAAAGASRYWFIDDDLSCVRSFVDGKLAVTDPGAAFASIEDLVDRYDNVALAGLRSTAYGRNVTTSFQTNVQVYVCVLASTAQPYRWRPGLMDDTDICLQVLSGGWCTILVNAFQIESAISGALKGGCTDSYLNDGRLAQVRELQRRWPGTPIKVTRRHGEPRMIVGHVWKHFTTPLHKRAPEGDGR